MNRVIHSRTNFTGLTQGTNFSGTSSVCAIFSIVQQTMRVSWRAIRSSYFFVVEPTDTPEKLHLGDHTKVVLMNKAMMPMIERLQHTQEARVNLFPNRREAGGV